MAAEKKKKNPYDFWVKFVLFLFIAMLLSIFVEQIQEENFKRRPILEVTNVIKITKKDVIVISFTDGSSYEAEGCFADYGLKQGQKIRFSLRNGMINRIQVVD